MSATSATGLPLPDSRSADASSTQVESIVRQHGGMVRRALRQLGVAPHLVDDAAQDVFVVLVRRVEDFDRNRSLSNWLWGIAKGVASGYRRSGRRRGRLHAALAESASAGSPGSRPGEVEARCGGAGRPTWAVSMPSDQRSVEQRVAGRQASEILAEFLTSLDEGKCAVFVMSEIEGCSGPEIAQRLSLNVNTVYARLRAARRSFDAAMRGAEPSDARPLFASLLPSLGTPLGLVGAAAVAALAMPSVELPRDDEMRLAGYHAIPDAVPVASRGAVSVVDDPKVAEVETPGSSRRTRAVHAPQPEVSSELAFASDPLDFPFESDDGIVEQSAALGTDDSIGGQGLGRRPSPRRAGQQGEKPMLTLALAAALAAPAPAPQPSPTTDADADDAARVGGDGVTAVYEFFDDEIAGDRLKSDGTIILQRPSVRHKSLIDVRGHFNGEIIVMALDV